MKDKVLILASVASMIDQFNMSNINILLSLGYEVDVACNFKKGSTCTDEKIEQLKIKLEELGVKYYQIDFTRSVFNFFQDIKSYMQVKHLMKNNNYKFIHCHSPIGGVIGRLSCRATKTKCIYTAHGFHFFKGAPKKDWLIFYPIEKWLSKYTDVLITINNEDYSLAKKKMYCTKVIKVPGVGVDTNKYRNCNIEKDKYRNSLSLSNDDFVIISVGELCKRKNHSVVIKALSILNNNHVKYLIVGKGEEKNNLEQLINDLNLNNQVQLLGFRTDIPELCRCSDLYAFPSKREGLGLAAIEGMASGLPLISSNVNGINDYSINGITGYSCQPDDVDGFSKSIKMLLEHTELRDKFKSNCIEISKIYDIKNVDKIMKKIYKDFI